MEEVHVGTDHSGSRRVVPKGSSQLQKPARFSEGLGLGLGLRVMCL